MLKGFNLRLKFMAALVMLYANAADKSGPPYGALNLGNGVPCRRWVFKSHSPPFLAPRSPDIQAFASISSNGIVITCFASDALSPDSAYNRTLSWLHGS